MSQIDDLLKIASAEIGVAEDPIGSNNVKYNTEYYGHEVSGDSYPWCVTFVWWCFREAGLSHLFYNGGKTASCTALMKWAKAKGLFVDKDYQFGDVFLYNTDPERDAYAEHTGIYTGTRDGRGRYVVIEGNYNNRVQMVSRLDSELHGAFRPNWQEETSDKKQEEVKAPQNQNAEVAIRLPVIRQNMTGIAVKSMQLLLIGRGYGCGPDRADGDYGPRTRQALLLFQKTNGLDADGICGMLTWNKLLKG